MDGYGMRARRKGAPEHLLWVVKSRASSSPWRSLLQGRRPRSAVRGVAEAGSARPKMNPFPSPVRVFRHIPSGGYPGLPRFQLDRPLAWVGPYSSSHYEEIEPQGNRCVQSGGRKLAPLRSAAYTGGTESGSRGGEAQTLLAGAPARRAYSSRSACPRGRIARIISITRFTVSS